MADVCQSIATGSLPPLIAAMTDPAFYAERPAAVELRQTHISYVLLAGDLVYKVKKPARFPFLDASCLAQRRKLCEEEVRLNRRLSPDVYLGVVPIVRRGAGFAMGGPEAMAGACEFAVKMRRLDEGRMLDRLVREGTAQAAMMRAVAARVFSFHATVADAQGWRWGSAAAVWRRVIGDLADYARFIGYTVTEGAFGDIESYCRAFIASHWETINERARAGKVRECHGDLRAEQICMEREISIFDCLEFSERLRYCDVASEVAFLAMDLDRLEAPHLAQDFVASYVELAGDHGLAAMLPFYKCYRASIRGMVESWRSLTAEVSPADREASRALARRYFALAHRYTALAAPAIIAICGLSGTGKSTLARALRERIGFEVVSSDETRKRLGAVARTEHPAEAYAEGIYSDDFSRRTYAELVAKAFVIVREATGVILDATFKDPRNRRLVVESAARARVPVLFVECRCEESEVLRRLRHRALQPGVTSDATVEVYRRQRLEFVALDEVAAENHFVADTGRRDPITNALAVEERLAMLYPQHASADACIA
jgi:aminoglycoside phosphotransferase family enzyme/predicted kinase